MYIEQLYTGCLAEAAYYIESEGEAAIVDPIRDTEPYIDLAKKRGAVIRYIFETHFHADFVSGHIDLARKTGAAIVFGPEANTEYEVYNAKDGEVFELGGMAIRALHTPGHTPESTCYLVYDAEGREQAIFTGDTLFVGDVGRPDLLDDVGVSREEQVLHLYRSLNTKIKTLPDDVVVYPAHGPGSMCGKNIGRERQSTIGREKQHNYALQDMAPEEFMKVILEGQPAAPQYFIQNAIINRKGYESIDNVLERNVRALSVDAIEAEIGAGALVLDTRKAEVFGEGFIPGAINIGLDGSFAVWVGTIIDIKKRLVVVAEPGREGEVVLRLARVGFENVAGYLEGGFDTWLKAGRRADTVHSVTAADFAEARNETTVLDVRRPAEYAAGHVKGAVSMPLRDIEAHLDSLRPEQEYYIHCAIGYRSMIAVSLLKAHGIDRVTNVLGGFDMIRTTSTPIEEPAELMA